MLLKLKKIKKNARNIYRKRKKAKLNSKESFRYMMQAVRAHNSLLKLVEKEKKELSALKQQEAFLSNHHKYAKELLSPKKKGKPKFEKKVADDYFTKTYSNRRVRRKIKAHKHLARPKAPKHKFNSSFPDYGYFSDIVKKKSNSSSPGVNGNGYVVYKAAPKVRRLLWKLLRVAWENDLVAPSWQLAWIRLLQKSEDTSQPSKMRPISILNVEGRILFTVVNK